MNGFLAQATEPIRTPSIDWLAIAPYIALFGAAIVIVLGKALLRGRSWLQEGALLVACLGVLTSGVFVFVQWTGTVLTRPSRAWSPSTASPSS